MSDALPFLLFPRQEPSARRRRNSNPGPTPAPKNPEARWARLAPRFQQLETELAENRQRLQTSLGSAYPEDALVFTVAGTVRGFRTAVRNSSLAWLAASLDDEVVLDDWEADDKPVRGRTVYFVGATESGQRELLSLWRRFTADPSMTFRSGMTGWRDLFQQLDDVRRYGREDRVDHLTVQQLLASAGRDESLRMEVELWHSRSGDVGGVQRAVRDVGGRVVHAPDAFQDAGVTLLLIEVPPAAARRIAEDETATLTELSAVRALRVAPQAEAVAFTPPTTGGLPRPGHFAGSPTIAILDGLPVENHVALRGGLIVDDPDAWAETTPVEHRRHGTAVASVVLWRDLDKAASHGRRPVYLRPVLRWPGHGTDERSPADQVFADLLRRAVRRMLGPDGGVAPEVAVINLSIGISNRIYDGREPSPLARVLDSLSWRYKVLFLVATGNVGRHHDVLDIPSQRAEDEQSERQRWAARMLRSDVDQRRLLSPAESVNALSVGATDNDASDYCPPRYVRCWSSTAGPALYSRCGLGFRRSLKPELVAPGGAEPLQFFGTAATPFRHQRSVHPVGVAVAAPGTVDKPLEGKSYSRGTSYAAPRLAHAASRLSDALDDLATSARRDLFAEAPRSLWIKCLLVHASSRTGLEAWADSDGDGPDPGLLDRFVGFGEPDLARLGGCTQHRATVLGGGWLRQDEAMSYQLPLPRRLRAAGTGYRELRATVAWFAPPDASSAMYRGAKLRLDIEQPERGLQMGSQQVGHHTVERGTVTHRVWGKRGRFSYADDASVTATVSCMADARRHIDEPVPFVVAVSFDVAPDLKVPIYDEIRSRLTVPVRPAVRARG